MDFSKRFGDLALTKQGSIYLLTYADTGNWLEEGKRAYPVIIDPSIVTIDGSSGGADTIIRNGNNPYPYYNYGAHSRLLVTKDASYERRSILRFPDPKDFGIPNDALISSASLNLRSVYWSDAAEVSVHRLLRPWKEGSGNPSATNSASIDGATWLERRYGDNQNNGNSPFNESDPDWTTSGGDYNPAVEDTQSFATADRMAWDFYWIYDITKVFRQWAVGDVENHGLLLKALNVGDTVTFNSKEDSTYEPYIEVNYYEPSRWGIGPSWTYQDVAVGGGVNASVNVDNGNLVVSKPLQTLPGRGVPLEFQPTYNSFDTDIHIGGPMGHIWTSGLAPSLTDEAGNVVVKERSGLEHNFFKNSSGIYVHSATENSTLSYSSSTAKYTYKQADGTKYVFDASSSNRIDYIVDVKGNTTSYNYDWLTGRLETITDPSGRDYDISWANGLIDEITDPSGRKSKFSYYDYYEDFGYGPIQWTLVSSIVEAYETSEARTVSFGYQGKNLISITDPRGITTGFTYWTSGGYEGVVKTINYPGTIPDTNIAFRSQGATTSYTDIKHLGLTTEYQLDAYSGNVHALTQSPNADPLIQQSEYATGNDLLEESELRAPTEAVVSSSFDYEPSENGNPSDNIIEEELPSNGNPQTSSYSYASDTDTGARDNITQEKYSSGLEENTEYDAESNPTEESENVLDGSSIDTGSTYDSYGNQLKGSLNINRNFNLPGNPDMEIPGSNYRPKYWDQTDSTDNIEGSTTVTRSGTYKRAGDYSLRIYRTTSSISTYSRVKGATVSVSPGTLYSLSSYIKTLSTVTTGSATIDIFWYKSTGAPSSIKQANSWVLGYHKDASDWARAVAQITTPGDAYYARITPTLRGPGGAYFDSVQFEEGPLASSYNPVTNNSFEEWTSGNPDDWIKVGTGTFQSTSSAIAGTKALNIRSTGSNQPYVYQTITISANRNYSLAGWAKTINVNNAKLAAQFYRSTGSYIQDTTYYAHNLTTGTADWALGFVNLGEAPSDAKLLKIFAQLNYDSPGTGDAYFDNITVLEGGVATESGYDSNANYLTSSKDTYGNQTTYSYDTSGNQVGETNPHGVTTRKGYDILNRLTSITLDEGGIDATTNYKYDKTDNLTSVRDAESTGAGHRETTYSYNEQNQIVGVKDAMGNVITYSYDNRKNMNRADLASGRFIIFSYDVYNRLNKIETSDMNTISYNLNAQGKADTVEIFSNASRILSRGYDYYPDQSLKQERESTSTSSPNYNINYTYDREGNPTKLVEKYNSSTLRTITQAFDYQGNLTYVNGSYLSYDERGNNRRLGRSGSVIYNNYDSENRPTSIIAKASTGPEISRYLYTYDEEGHILSETGSQTNYYTYDDLDRLKTWGNGSATTSYTYDKVGNILSISNGTTTSYTYRDDNSILKRNGVTFTYDLDGNLTSDGTSSYSYDGTGKLIGINKAGVSTSYQYDHLGRRTRKTVNGAITKYKYDGWNVLREMNSDESETLAEYTYGKGGRPLSMSRNGDTYYYIYNVRGDITALINSSGTVVNSYTYDPWGKHLAVSESVENPYRYASYRYDSDTDLYYLQNRYYSPETMRFLTRDAIYNEIGNCNSCNRYHYANNNPVINIDPDGLKSTRYITKKQLLYIWWGRWRTRKHYEYSYLDDIFISYISAAAGPSGRLIKCTHRIITGVYTKFHWRKKYASYSYTTLKVVYGVTYYVGYYVRDVRIDFEAYTTWHYNTGRVVSCNN